MTRHPAAGLWDLILMIVCLVVGIPLLVAGLFLIYVSLAVWLSPSASVSATILLVALLAHWMVQRSA